MNRIVIAVQGQGKDVMQNAAIWGRKRHRPFLCRSDGEIGIYRRYCGQFYPDGRACAPPASSPGGPNAVTTRTGRDRIRAHRGMRSRTRPDLVPNSE